MVANNEVQLSHNSSSPTTDHYLLFRFALLFEVFVVLNRTQSSDYDLVWQLTALWLISHHQQS